MKILPVTYPTITTFPAYADALAILMSNKATYDWVYSHYIQMYTIEILDGDPKNIKPFMPCVFGDFDNRRIAYTVADCFFLDRETCPFLNIFEIPNAVINKYETSYVQFIKKAIDMSMYVFMLCDVSRIKAYNLSKSLAHEVLIYGYDDSSKELYYADFLNNRSNKYTFSTCSYDEIDAAINGISDLFIPVVKSIALVQLEERGPFTFNMDYIRESVNDYINPDSEKLRKFGMYTDSYVRNSEFKWSTKVYMGINVYDYLSDLRNRIDEDCIDVRLYHAMYEHKKMMSERIGYICNKGLLCCDTSLFTQYQSIVNRWESIRNGILKYNISQNASSKRRIVQLPEIINKIKADEIAVLKQVFDL